MSFAEQGPFSVGATVLATALDQEHYSFGHWTSPLLSGTRTQTISLAAENDLKVVFLPHTIAAVNRWARKSYSWLPEWYRMPSAPDIYYSETGWAHSENTGWIITTAVGDILFSWLPEFGWTATRSDWFPYHWSYDRQDWIYFE